MLGIFRGLVSLQENDASVRLKIASLLGLLSKTAGFSPDCIMDDAINTLQNESKSHFWCGAWGQDGIVLSEHLGQWQGLTSQVLVRVLIFWFCEWWHITPCSEEKNVPLTCLLYIFVLKECKICFCIYIWELLLLKFSLLQDNFSLKWKCAWRGVFLYHVRGWLIKLYQQECSLQVKGEYYTLLLSTG